VIYPRIVRPLLFRLDAEAAHASATRMLALAHRSSAAHAMLRAAFAEADDPALAIEVLGLSFRNPIGVAAGFDKHATLYNALGALGFGAVEVGTLTAHAQPGNERPRLFRLPDDRAVINRMGFNNPGAEAAEVALRTVRPRGVVLGVNLGKSKVTPLDEAAADYAESARRLGPYADYLVINVSSPNTPGLRSLQSVEALAPIVKAVREATGARRVPLLVKIAPDLVDEDLDAVADFARAEALDGLIATNTTLSREGLCSDQALVTSIGAGGLSGAPLRARATAVIARLWRRMEGSVPIIGVGGIAHADDVWEKITAGASLVQVYTGFIYEGPSLVRVLLRGLTQRLHREGYARLIDAVGSAHTRVAPRERR
jgi:dihydroorotate dehydrogenase